MIRTYNGLSHEIAYCVVSLPQGAEEPFMYIDERLSHKRVLAFYEDGCLCYKLLPKPCEQWHLLGTVGEIREDESKAHQIVENRGWHVFRFVYRDYQDSNLMCYSATESFASLAAAEGWGMGDLVLVRKEER